MPNPKRRHSHSRTRLRRAHDFLTHSPLGKCSQCGSAVPRHQICGYCGFYRGVEVIKMTPPEEKPAEAATPAEPKQ